jgi:hypothetical protein
MTLKPGLTVAGWAALNVVLAAVMFVYHEKLVFIAMYFAATLPLLAVGLLLARGDRKDFPPPDEYSVGQRGGWVLPLAIGVMVLGLGVIYARIFIVIGVLIALLALVMMLSRPVTNPPGTQDELMPYPVPARRASSSPTSVGLASRLAVAALTVLGWRRRSKAGK